jgi:hypothetical protein
MNLASITIYAVHEVDGKLLLQRASPAPQSRTCRSRNGFNLPAEIPALPPTDGLESGEDAAASRPSRN